MAIKVNGTTVINDSRALTNIASVDAATVTALGNAGVGGATSLITDVTSFTNVSSVTVDLTTGHDIYYIRLYSVVKAANSNNLSGYARLTDSTGTSIDGGEYQTMELTHSGNTKQNSDGVYTASTWYPSNFTGRLEADYVVWDPNNSSVRTRILANSLAKDSTSSITSTKKVDAYMLNAEVHNSFVFAAYYSVSITGSYKVWGVTL
jgi:hypothetical protein